jgi:hypothetical protein
VYEAGQLLQVTGGKLAPISAAQTTTPPYLCMGSISAADGDSLPVARIMDDMVYVTTLSAAAADAVVGSKLRISAGGKEVDGGAAGSFEVVALDGTAMGDIVYGRFI